MVSHPVERSGPGIRGESVFLDFARRDESYSRILSRRTQDFESLYSNVLNRRLQGNVDGDGAPWTRQCLSCLPASEVIPHLRLRHPQGASDDTSIGTAITKPVSNDHSRDEDRKKSEHSSQTARTIAPKKAKAQETMVVQKQLQRAINAHIEQEIKMRATKDITSFKLLKEKPSENKEKK
ncbi:uncharacterized protein [Panulirus ornatus]|uniref:uncharacterized protein n=1 Tax=Panulirus ornatus TaxID=150431 RepID=UPI003A85F855